MSIRPKDPRAFLAVLLSGLVTLIAVGIALFGPDLSNIWKWLILAVAAIASMLVSYLEGYREIINLGERVERRTVEVILENTVYKFQSELDIESELRANVMLVEERRVGLVGGRKIFSALVKGQRIRIIERERTLSIQHTIGHYSSEEIRQKYAVENEEGASGTAFNQDRQIVYDRSKRPEPEESMNADQLAATDQIGSIISVPLYSADDEKIGVLNLDSEGSLSETKFDSRISLTVMRAQARIIEEYL